MPGKPGQRWFLTITTHAGITPDAVHYYGRIRAVFHSTVIEVEKKRLGTTLGNTIRFESEEEVIEAAKKWFHNNGKPGESLTLGNKVLARKNGKAK
jgi:hypothetical protein